MKNKCLFFLSGVTCLSFGLASCGAAEPAPETTPMLATEDLEPSPPPPVSKPEPPPATPSVSQRVAATGQSKCEQFEEEDGSIMVTAQDYDWFLYVTANAQVECGTFGGNVTITDGNLKQIIKPLVPEGADGAKAEEMLRDQAVGFIRSGLQSEYGDGRDLAFEKTKLGKLKRPALCADADLNLKGFMGRVVACVTSKTNVNDEVVVHRSIWIGEAGEYDENATPKLVKEASANWFRYSDTDGLGKILIKW
ncbi:MAG: hypothetical protein JXX14_19845 [Deltaproteobacteria bacterium]|nr:hypothetical protein [Deltaproteobacteria bacterium]